MDENEQGQSGQPTPTDRVYYIPPYPQQDANKGIPRPENSVEFLKFVLDPEIRKQYTHITKDLAISNADHNEIAYLQINLQLLHLIDFIEVEKTHYKKVKGTNQYTIDKEADLDPTKHVILKDIYCYLQLLRSKLGFERQLEATQILKQFSTLREEQQKKGWFK